MTPSSDGPQSGGLPRATLGGNPKAITDFSLQIPDIGSNPSENGNAHGAEIPRRRN
jgi:hypothetical protein